MSANEIENAIRQLPHAEAAALFDRLKDIVATKPDRKEGLTDEVIAKWRGQFSFPPGVTSTDEYLRMIRGGDRD